MSCGPSAIAELLVKDIITFTVYVTSFDLGSPSNSICQKKLNTKDAFQFMCKHIIVNMCNIS